MPIAIKTYCNPYRLADEPYWNDIRSCPYFCVSQTTVNGLKRIYPDDFRQGRVTTVRTLTDALFESWESAACIVRQHADIDNIISNGLPSGLKPQMRENIAQAFRFNREEVFNSLRVMFELDIDVREIRMDRLTNEQSFIVEIFKKILSTDKRNDFELARDFDSVAIDRALGNAMYTANNDVVLSEIEQERIVIHGVHQFSPILLRAIGEIAKFKQVILLFNYQPQYKNAYQTWIDIYTAFDSPILASGGAEFHPDMALASYGGNLLADNMGKLIEGRTDRISLENVCQITEFDNMTEFAGYVAHMFETAARKDPVNPIGHMREQIYSANGAVNDILKIYFPEQFGERKFLDYPLGHFFIAIANMWDANENRVRVASAEDIRECFGAGILQEDFTGQLSTIFGRVSALFEGADTLDEMIKRLKRLEKYAKYLSDPDEKERLGHISYCAAPRDELERLIRALNELQELARYFYEDFEEQSHNFREFYKKLRSYLQRDILDARELDDDFSDIIRRVLARLEEVKTVDASASFECLKSTMSIYLTQEAKPGMSANWIVREFEQIDGDITRSDTHGAQHTVYHFACLTDEDMSSPKRADFPWPLNDDFFEVAQEPVDWKYQVYVRSRREYRNFKRYALIYGLEFNRGEYRLSYVRRDGEKEREPYYLLKMLGAKVVRYDETRMGSGTLARPQINVNGTPSGEYDEYDLYRYRVCKYRFLLESLAEGTTVYKDGFLLAKYMEVMLENRVREALQGRPASEVLLDGTLNDIYGDLKKYFPFLTGINRMDVIGGVRKRLLSSQAKGFPMLGPGERRYMTIRELFIYKKLEDARAGREDVMQEVFIQATRDGIERALSAEALKNVAFRKKVDLWCRYCADREFCAACYAASERI